MLRVRVLGHVAVEYDGRCLEMPRGMPSLLIAHLALHPGPQSRRRVAQQLWPDVDTEAAHHRLRTALWEIRRAVAEVDRPLIHARHGELSLHDEVTVDLVEAGELLRAGAAETALRLVAPGIATELDQDWAEHSRHEVDDLRLRALASAAAQATEPGRALSHARQRVALDPLSETAHQDLIRLLAHSGDRSAAMAAYEEMRRVLDSELGIGPSRESRRLLARLSSEDARLTEPTIHTVRRRVPVATTPLLGREDVLADLLAAVRDHRLVTAVGPGGVGKSRVAFAAAQQEADRGRLVAVAELATTLDSEACDYIVAAALGVHCGPGRSVRDAVLERLDLEPTLLVLDNCEHVLDTARGLVTHLLRWSERTTVLLTSRMPLALPGEHLVHILPLALPAEGDDAEAVLASPAVQLLVRGVGHRDALSTSYADADELARLARRLDGLPLALELAAARVPSLGVAVLEERLVENIDVLSTGRSPAAGRHDSLRRTLEWSMTMLSPHERTLLGLVSQVPGSFPVSAVEEVVRACALSTDAVVGLARLVEASLVQVHHDEVLCYSALETVRAFGVGLLDDGTAATAWSGLVRWAVLFAESVRRRENTAEERVHQEMVRYLPLVRAALRHARDCDDLEAQRRIITGIEGWSTWQEQPEVWSWVIDLAAAEPEEEADAEVLRMGAVAAWRLGRVGSMKAFTERCVAADPGGSRGATATPALMLVALAERRWADAAELAVRAAAAGGAEGTVAMTVAAAALARSGRPQAAQDAARTARRDADRIGAPSLRALALLAEARTVPQGEAEQRTDADAMLADARLLAASVGGAELVASIDKEHGLQSLRRGDAACAVEHLRLACLHWLGTGNDAPLAAAVNGLAESLVGLGRGEAAQRLLEAAQTGELNASRLVALTGGE